MLIVFRPLILNELTSLIELPDDKCNDHVLLKEVIGTCGSFLTLRENIILFIYQSAKDFLLQAATNEILPRGIEDEYHSIFTQSLEVMFKTLRHDIFDIRSPRLPIRDISKPSPNPLAVVEYAYVYWVDHLEKSQRNEVYRLIFNDERPLEIFLQEKYLHCLEALSILCSVLDGIRAIQRLEILIKVSIYGYIKLVLSATNRFVFTGD